MIFCSDKIYLVFIFVDILIRKDKEISFTYTSQRGLTKMLIKLLIHGSLVFSAFQIFVANTHFSEHAWPVGQFILNENNVYKNSGSAFNNEKN